VTLNLIALIPSAIILAILLSGWSASNLTPRR